MSKNKMIFNRVVGWIGCKLGHIFTIAEHFNPLEIGTQVSVVLICINCKKLLGSRYYVRPDDE
jgi:hypothetical protein